MGGVRVRIVIRIGILLQGKYVVLLFYPMDFTFVCPTEILAFSNKMDEFKEIGAEVLGISTDSKFVHVAWTKTPREEGGRKCFFKDVYTLCIYG